MSGATARSSHSTDIGYFSTECGASIMADIGQNEATITTPGAAHFQQQWQAYRKVVDNNYMFHREVYGLLHRILEDEAAKPIRFLDIACGDARATVGALKGLPVAHYHGIDLSGPALE